MHMNAKMFAAATLAALLAVLPGIAEDKLVLDGSTTIGPIAKAFA